MKKSWMGLALALLGCSEAGMGTTAEGWTAYELATDKYISILDKDSPAVGEVATAPCQGGGVAIVERVSEKNSVITFSDCSEDGALMEGRLDISEELGVETTISGTVDFAGAPEGICRFEVAITRVDDSSVKFSGRACGYPMGELLEAANT